MLLELAQAAAESADAMPSWVKYVLGPLGALVLLLVYAYYTEKVRIPALRKQIKELRNQVDETRDLSSIKKSTIRRTADERESELESEVGRLRAARAWWQAKATGAFKRLKEDLTPPERYGDG